MNFWSNLTEVLKIKLHEIGKIFDDGVSLNMIRAIVYSAILANEQEQGNEVDFNIYQVGAWLDDLDPEQLEGVVAAMTESKILGNDLNVGIKRNVKKSTKASGK